MMQHRVFLLCLVAVVLPVTSAFAAAKKKGGKKNTRASTHRGFGTAPPTLEEVLAKFKTRLPEAAEAQPCPCGVDAGKSYGECCAPYHQGQAKPMVPLAVLQSRYSAFAYRNVGYVLKSTHPSCRDYKEDKISWAKGMDKNGMFDSFEFIGLTVVGDTETEGEDEAFVEFQVRLRAAKRTGSLLEGQQTTIQERSKFVRDESDGSWSYASGDVRSTVEGVDDIILNA